MPGGGGGGEGGGGSSSCEEEAAGGGEGGDRHASRMLGSKIERYMSYKREREMNRRTIVRFYAMQIIARIEEILPRVPSPLFTFSLYIPYTN